MNNSAHGKLKKDFFLQETKIASIYAVLKLASIALYILMYITVL